ncbi:3'-5' exonuclease [Campylobacter gastrosuis]|uniref:3'-5' exonuclease n=1 Tax=Campylobacter gastrosuis TaxID=2974576 RepID=A0ABT7HPV3_9BACT|nr:3'-5' exonuclease [Campylobacter gastrosuis]MDL0088869.1 3'-5' exonuclease [Campylobacter gastrosuis]
MAKSYICVFDCETIPDANLLRKIYDFSGDDLEVSLQAFEYQKSVSGSEFLPIIFHKVVAISAVMADEFGRFIRVSTLKGENEREILTKFINFINEHNPRLVSFNGRGFDLPMIMARAMRYNLSAAAYFEVDNKILNKNKWENYKSRYDGRFHIDLLDHISDFGAVRGLKLDTLCAALNLPGKYDVSGDQVLELFYEGEIEKINEYCESDVLNTYWLFLKYELLRANLTLDDYANCLNLMSAYLEKNCVNRGYTSVFCELAKDELNRLKSGNYEENFTQNVEISSGEISQKMSINELENELKNLGLADTIKKGANIALKPKKPQNDDDLPSINLDDE